MQILFLGTGPADAIPRAGHADPACLDALAGGKSRRSRSSALIKTADARILIDSGPDVSEQLKRESVKRIDAVFLTHGHEDACGGMDQLNRWASLRSRPFVLPVFTDRVTKARLQKRFGNLPSLRWVAIKPLDLIRVQTTNIRPFSVKHSMTPGFPAMGYLINKKLAYASDVASIPTPSQNLIRGVPLFVLDGTFYPGKKALPSHLTSDEAIAYGKKLGVKKLILTQIGHSYPPHDEAQKTIKGARIAYDGLRVNV